MVLRCKNLEPHMSLVGQNEKPPFSGLCQLTPAAADIRPGVALNAALDRIPTTPR
jgi:hypothetical protein